MNVLKMTVPVPVEIPADQVVDITKGTIQKRANDLFDQLGGALRDDLAPKLRSIQDDVNRALNEASEKSLQLNKELLQMKKDLEDEKDRIHARTTRIVIPAAIAGMLACALGAWAVLGSSVLAMRAELRQATADVQTLEATLAAKRQEIADYGATFATVKAKVDDLNSAAEKARTGSTPIVEESRVKTIEEDLRLLRGQVEAYGKVVAAKASAPTTVVLPPSPAPASPAKGSDTVQTTPTK